MPASLYERVRSRCGGFATALPNKKEAGLFIRDLLDILFAHGHRTNIESASEWDSRLRKHLLTLSALLTPFTGESRATELAAAFFETELLTLYDTLWQDAEAAYAGDPAAQNIQEVILAYPGFYAVAVYRIAHYFYAQNVPTLPRLFSEHAHEKTGVDIHPGAKIGKSFFMDHGTGIVIGGTSIIADNVKIYQGVTLGALSVQKNLASTKRHPTIEEGVVIYAGATILGGETVIGRHSVIGGNTWLVESVPPYSIVYHKSEVRVRPSKEISAVIDFTI